jgi:hypothetical protein
MKTAAAENHRRDQLGFWDLVLMVRAAGGPAEAVAPRALLAAFVGTAAPFVAMIFSRDPSPSTRFFILAGLCIPISAMSTATFEVRRTAALAFLRTIPQPHAPRSLVLWPAGGLGVLVALASLSVLPVPAAVALFGCWCWAMAIGHRFAGRSVWLLLSVAVPLAYVALYAAALSFAAGGLRGLAAVSATLGLAGCLASPRDRFLALVATRSERPPRRAQDHGGAADVPIREDRRSGRRGTAIRIFRLAFRPSAPVSITFWWVAMAVSGVCLLLVTLVSSPMRVLPGTLTFELAAASGLVASSSRSTREFFSTRPVGRWLLRSAVLPWVLLGLVFPAIALVRATTHPTVARAGLASVDSVRRLALLHLALFFSLAALGVVNERKGWSRTKWTSLALVLTEFALITPTLFPWLGRTWQLPPLWLALLLAAIGVAVLGKRLAVPA